MLWFLSVFHFIVCLTCGALWSSKGAKRGPCCAVRPQCLMILFSRIDIQPPISPLEYIYLPSSLHHYLQVSPACLCPPRHWWALETHHDKAGKSVRNATKLWTGWIRIGSDWGPFILSRIHTPLALLLHA
jgi:hypothetical protein